MKESHEEALAALREVLEHRITQRLVQRQRLVREGKSSVEGPPGVRPAGKRRVGRASRGGGRTLLSASNCAGG
jgi:hypothetical protein